MSAEPIVLARAGRFELLQHCEWPECSEPAVGASWGGRYCEPHKQLSRRAHLRSDRVWEYVAKGLSVEEANRRAREDYP